MIPAMPKKKAPTKKKPSPSVIMTACGQLLFEVYHRTFDLGMPQEALSEPDFKRFLHGELTLVTIDNPKGKGIHWRFWPKTVTHGCIMAARSKLHKALPK